VVEAFAKRVIKDNGLSDESGSTDRREALKGADSSSPPSRWAASKTEHDYKIPLKYGVISDHTR
jgi:alpha-galactosidase/6-phospho-beta-glucosidase family protein